MATKNISPQDPMIDPETGEQLVIAPGYTFRSVTDKLTRIVFTSHTPLGWFLGLAVAGSAVGTLSVAVIWLFLKGTGIWGISMPVAWGFAIVNFVWWIGIGHAGTLISAILLLFKQSWRNSINRFAEAMTLFAVVCAGMFPVIHTGRPWLAIYWLFPYPNTMNVWPQFRSPLMWDVFAVSTYATISVVFWYVGMIPDLGTMRDRAKSKFARFAYGHLSLGWRGSARHWMRYESASLLLAGLALPLVLSVHSVIALDFAVAVMPGWHTTIFPPYFVVGAMYSGWAAALTLAVPIRKFYGLEDLITMRHLDNMAKMLLASGLILSYSYSMETVMAWYSASKWEYFMAWNRMFGPLGWVYWILITVNLVVPCTTLWSRRLRKNTTYLFLISLLVNAGMWFERFVIVVTSLTRDYLPSSWGTFKATRWDYMTYAGTIGLFALLFLLFIRFLPMIPMSELRMILPGAKLDEAKLQSEGKR
ncbi:MAG: NrfD/PsrC family molybdoenzyme membrane anchor subunit [Acidobacteriaceae bacterium]